MPADRRRPALDLDVVTVPDFREDRAPVDEARSLFLLASWIESIEELRDLPLTLACIGSPPDTVSSLAEKAGASLSICSPVSVLGSKFANKLRGLEVGGDRTRRLLVDSDVLFLGSLDALAKIDASLAASPEYRPWLEDWMWFKICNELGIDPPNKRQANLPAGIELTPETRPVMPYFNAGVVLSARGTGLRRVWEDHAGRIPEIALSFGEQYQAWNEFSFSDQTSFATAVEALRQQGVTFAHLPEIFNTRRALILRGAIHLQPVRIYHAVGLCKNISDRAGAYPDALRRYSGNFLRSAMRLRGTRGRVYQLLSLAFGRPHLLMDWYRVRRILRRLYARHVVGALKSCGKSSVA